METIYSRSGQIVTEPMERPQVKARVVNGFARPEHRTALVELKVLVAYPGSSTLPGMSVGDSIWVKASQAASGWAKEKFEVTGIADAILVPETEVVLFCHADRGTAASYGTEGPR